MITQEDIKSLVKAASFAGIKVDIKDLQLLVWNKGIKNHIISPLPIGCSAIYIFKHKKKYLKVGMAGSKSAPRYQSHHYHTTAPSTLAKSLLKDAEYSYKMGTQQPKNWIIENTTRYNILIPAKYSKNFVNFAEAFFILKCNPRFEK